MATTITASLTVQFQDNAVTSDTTGALRIEVDSRADGLNAGKSSFRPGDPVGLLVFYADNVSITRIEASAGGISNVTDIGTYPVGHATDFAQKKLYTFDYESYERSLDYPVLSGFSATWRGDSLGSVQLIDYSTTLKIDQPGQYDVGLLDVVYNARFRGYRLTGVPITVPAVYVKVWGSIA